MHTINNISFTYIGLSCCICFFVTKGIESQIKLTIIPPIDNWLSIFMSTTNTFSIISASLIFLPVL